MNAEGAQMLLWERLSIAAGVDPCPHCGGQGYVTLDVPLKHELFGKAFKCICQRAAALERATNLALKGAEDSIPQSAYQFDFPDFGSMSHAASAVKAARALIAGANKPGLVLHGGTGTGKTTLALITLRYIASEGLQVAWIEYTELIRRIQATYNKDSYEGASEEDILNALVKSDLLVIDDLGSMASDRPASENRIEILFRVINGRYARNARTIITTNLSPERLKFQFGERIYSRVIGMSEVVSMSGKDLRVS